MRAAEISLDLQPVGFVARESTYGTCSGCLFEGQRFMVCQRACDAAKSAGQPDCDDRAPGGGNFIYVIADARQLVLPTCEGDANAP